MSPLRITLSCLMVLAAFGCATKAKQKSPFRFEPVGDRSLGLWEGERPVFVYNHGEIANPAAPKATPRGSYVHPIYGIDGEVLTDDFPKDHVNHRGLYWAWPHVTIGDKPYDLWSLRGIRSSFVRWIARDVRPAGATLAVENGWFVDGIKVVREEVRLDVKPAAADARAIDVAVSLTPLDRPLTLRGAEGKGYGGLSLRFGPRKRTFITVPDGRTDEDLVITRLPWADLTGDLSGKPDVLSGAAIFVHPDHPAFPPEWMTRHYGMLAAGWPGVKPQTIPAGESVTLRYRLWVHRGNPEAAEIQKAYEAYRANAR